MLGGETSGPLIVRCVMRSRTERSFRASGLYNGWQKFPFDKPEI